MPPDSSEIQEIKELQEQVASLTQQTAYQQALLNTRAGFFLTMTIEGLRAYLQNLGSTQPDPSIQQQIQVLGQLLQEVQARYTGISIVRDGGFPGPGFPPSNRKPR
jgi:hypothetical protein